jgi:hypothetical protein
MDTATAHQIESHARPSVGLRLIDPPLPEPADATEGRQIGFRPYDDATQGRTLGSDWRDDATRARRGRL